MCGETRRREKKSSNIWRNATVVEQALARAQAVGALYPDLSGAMRTLRLTGGTTHDQRRNKEEGEGLTQGCGPH